MVKLFCAVIGVGSVFSVDIELSEMVGDLKEKIKGKKPGLFFYFDADLLKLYLAREGDTWLYSRGADIKAVKAKKIPDRIKNLMQEHLLLDEACRLNNDEYFGDNLEQVDRDIHVLVECPEEPDKSSSTSIELYVKGFVDAMGDIHQSVVYRQHYFPTANGGNKLIATHLARWIEIEDSSEAFFELELARGSLCPFAQAVDEDQALDLMDWKGIVHDALLGVPTVVAVFS
ncbi:hypothetical protein PInf_008670 [Phytophthora infestans]|nr:hypothetical protein PInf_008670 [Phytophthora infestans]